MLNSWRLAEKRNTKPLVQHCTQTSKVFKNHFRLSNFISKGILFVYDITNKNSFLNLKSWAQEILRSKGSPKDIEIEGSTFIEMSGEEIPIFFIGTKIDQAKNFLDSVESGNSNSISVVRRTDI
jgi:hypothetical protein